MGYSKNQIIAPLLEDFNRTNTAFVVKYVEKFPDTFDNDLLEALAGGWVLICFLSLMI